MDKLKQMYDNLEKQIMTDKEVDDIVMAATKEAIVCRDDTSVQDIAARIEKKAAEVKNNSNTTAIYAISNTQELSKALNIYESRPTLNPTTEMTLARKLLDLSDKPDSKPKDIFNIAHKLSSINYQARFDDSMIGGLFRGSVARAYAEASFREKPDPATARHALRDLASLSTDNLYPADYFRLILPLDDEKTAEDFLKYTEKALQRAEARNGVNLGAGLIDSYTEIVRHHPEMAKKCNELVNKTANLQLENGEEADTYDLAYKYYEEVKKMDGVSDYDKSMARIRSASWKRKAWRAKQEKEQSQHQTQQKNQEVDFQKKGPELDL